MLSDAFCDASGIARGAEPSALIEHLRQSPTDPLDGLLTNDAARDAALESIAQRERYGLRIVKQLGIPQEKYCKVHIDGEVSPTLVAMLANCQAPSYATDMENLIFWELLRHESPLAATWINSGAGNVLQWRDAAKGLAIVAEPLPLKDSVGRTVAALLGLGDGGMTMTSISGAIAASASNLYVGAPTRTFSSTQSRLCFEAVLTNHPKWRFLSLYRLLEHAYLANIRRVLLDDFEKDAGRAVDEAKRKLESEVNQLVDLMIEAGLESEFIVFNQEFERLHKEGNQYTIALDRGARADPIYRQPDVTRKAVLRFYKVRCSIAHGGTSSVIYEQLPDAGEAMMALLPSVEAIALKSLAVRSA